MRRPVPLLASLATGALALAAAGASVVLAPVGTATAASVKPIPGIRSPSGNIRCLFVPPARGTSAPNLLCTIGHADYSAALQQRCIGSPTNLDWHGWELPAARRGAVTCSGGILYDPGTQRPTYTTLPYGRTWRRGPFTCVSRRSGVTCANSHGHGLFISRQSWRAW
jgi:hypothetical protein